MSVVSIMVTLNTRAAHWVSYLARENKKGSAKYIEDVVLRHLQTTLGVDLRRHPEQSRGASDGET